MNSKKAKKLRALVKHLQDRGMIENTEWSVYGKHKHEVWSNSNSFDPDIKETCILNPTCGKAIYRQMKKRLQLQK